MKTEGTGSRNRERERERMEKTTKKNKTPPHLVLMQFCSWVSALFEIYRGMREQHRRHQQPENGKKKKKTKKEPPAPEEKLDEKFMHRSGNDCSLINFLPLPHLVFF